MKATQNTAASYTGHMLTFLLVAAAGLGISFLLVPSQTDNAFISLKDNNISEAVARYEALLQKEGYQVRIVDALSQAYIAQGEVRKALLLLEDYVRRNPTRADALQRLADTYYLTQQRAAYIATLETLAQVDPTPQTLLKLLKEYNLDGNTKKQIATLEALQQRYPQSMDGPPIKLARLLAGEGEIIAAANILLADFKQHSQKYNGAQTYFLLELLFKGANAKDAKFVAAKTFENDPSIADMLQVTALLSLNNESPYALDLLAPVANKTKEPQLLAEKIRLEAEIDNGRLVADQQRAFEAGTQLNPTLLNAFINAAIARQDMPSVLRLLKLRNAPVADDVWLQLAEVAALTGTPESVKQLRGIYLQQYPNQDLAPPALALALVAKTNDAQTLANTLQLSQKLAFNTDERIALARILTLTNHREASAKLLSVFNKNTLFSNGDYLPLANVYLLNGQSKDGLALFEAIDRSPFKKATAFHVAYQLLKAAANPKDIPQVIGWLEQQPDDARLRQIARDLYFIALDNGVKELSYQVGDFLFRRENTEENAQMLMWAALQTGHEEDVLKRLDPAYLKLPAFETINLVLLSRHGHKDPAAMAELKALVQRMMADPTSTDIRKQEVLAILVENKQDAVALPYLKQIALAQKTSAWLYAYIEAAAKVGQVQEAASLMQQHYETLALTEEEKTNFAFYFLEAGAKTEALELFKLTAAEFGPKSAAAENLVFLWAENPTAENYQWLYTQAVKANAKAFTGWLAHLQELGGHSYIIKAIDTKYGQKTLADDVLMYRMVAALQLGQDVSAIKEQISAYIARSTSVPQLNTLGLQLIEANHIDLALQAFDRAMALDPNNVEIRLSAAQALQGQARYSRAVAMLEPLAAKNQLNWLGHVVYGLSLQGVGRTQAALPHLEKGRQNFPEADKTAQTTGGLYGQVLFRTGSRGEGLKHYEMLIKKYPEVLALQTDYAGLLVEDGQLKKAQQVLDATGKLRTKKVVNNE